MRGIPLQGTSMDIKVVNTVEDGNPQYRLGDAVLFRHHRAGKLAMGFVAGDQRSFGDTILYEYSTRIDPEDTGPQWPVLKDIVARKTSALNLSPPREDELVVHLRIGNFKGYKQPAEAFVDYLQDLVDSIAPGVDRLTIVTAIHNGKHYIENKTEEQLATALVTDFERVKRILDLLLENGISARLYSHDDIDRDFCFLSNARNLVLGNGHFSVCAAMVSNARCFIPPWVDNGEELDLDSLLESRERIFP